MAFKEAFDKCEKQKRPAYIPYLTAGFPEKKDTVDLLLALQKGGADIIELGVPFSDPIADGPTIQKSSFEALKQGIDVKTCLEFVKIARSQGLVVPVVLMSYYNPLLAFGEAELINECSKKEVDINGLIVVDTDVEDFKQLSIMAGKKNISLIPLVAPTTSDSRLTEIAEFSSGYVYCVSVTGVTGARSELPSSVGDYTDRVKKHIPLPRALGFGLSTHEHYKEIGDRGIAEGVVMGSKVIKVVDEAPEESRALTLEVFVRNIIKGK